MSNGQPINRVPLPYPKKDDIPWLPIVVLAVIPAYPATQIIALCMLINKMHTRKVIKEHDRMRSILNVLGSKPAISLKELTQIIGRPRSEVISTLNIMIARGHLGPEAYIDHSKDLLIIDRRYEKTAGAKRTGKILNVDFDFDEFKNVAGDIMQSIKESFMGAYTATQTGSSSEHAEHDTSSAGSAAHETKQSGGDSAVYDTVFVEEKEEKPAGSAAARPEPESSGDTRRKGHQDILDNLKRLNDQILDNAVSAKIDRISQLTDNIYEVVEQNPDRANEVRKFMNYYLPTTIKLLGSYAMLERQSYQGENILASRRNIEDILDTLVAAFEKQLDRLFAAEAVDISSDIKVLETMIAKDGLAQQAMQLKL